MGVEGRFQKWVNDHPKGIRVNLGCGIEVTGDIIGLDRFDFGNNFLCDFEVDRFPCEDNEVDFIFSNHCVEHLRDVKNFFNEAWRVLKSDGEIEIFVPYGLWDGAASPVHNQSITESWFDFFRRGKTKVYGYKRWEILKLERIGKVGEEIHCIMKKYVE